MQTLWQICFTNGITDTRQVGRQAPHGCGRRGPSVSERGSHGRRSAAGQVCAMGGTCVRWLRRGSARVLRAHRIARGARCEVSR